MCFLVFGLHKLKKPKKLEENQRKPKKTRENQKTKAVFQNQPKSLVFWGFGFLDFFLFSLVSSSFFFGVLVSLFEEEVPLDTSASLPHHFLVTSLLHRHYFITSSSIPHHFLITSSSLLHYFVTASSLPHHFLITSSSLLYYIVTTSSLPHHFLITSSSPPHHFFIASSLLHHCSLMTCSLLAQNMVDMSSHFLNISSSRCIWCYLWHLVDADTDLR